MCSNGLAFAGSGVVFEHCELTNISRTFSGKATNNRAELMAVIFAIDAILLSSMIFKDICFHVDSLYVVYGINDWWPTWMARNFARVHNLDLWRVLMNLLLILRNSTGVSFVHVKAHANIWQNELADSLAKNAAMRAMSYS